MTDELLLLLALLLHPLGDERFSVRQDGSRRLEAVLLQPGGHRLMAWLDGMRHDDCEVKRRVEEAMERFYHLSIPHRRWTPWIDQLPKEWPQRDRIIREYLEKATAVTVGENHGPAWTNYRVATVILARDMLRSGTPPDEVCRLLDRMSKAEVIYREKMGYDLRE